MCKHEPEHGQKTAFKIFCVTAASLCPGSFLEQMEKVAAAGVDGVILREKTLSEEAYGVLAEEVRRICHRYGVLFIAHSYPSAAGGVLVHLPEDGIGRAAPGQPFGVSVHSPEQARTAEQAGASYVTAGHIYSTACKAGIPPRGEAFLRAVVDAVSLPVYAIGGIGEENIARVAAAGAAGACLMSGFMQSREPAARLQRLRSAAASCLTEA